MDQETKRDIEDLKVSLRSLESEEANLLRELEQVRTRKLEVKDKLNKLSDDDKYQQDMLSMVYEQRKKAQNNPK